MNLDIDSIQPGWRVVDANGDDIGTVVEADGPDITVKKSGFFGGELHVPRDTIAEVETGRVEINRPKTDLA